MHKILVALLMVVLMSPAGGFAQNRLTNHQPPTINQQIGDHDGTIRLAIHLPAELMREAVSSQQPPRERSWPGRHPVLFGALVGLGAGLAVEAVVIPGQSGGEPHSAYIPMFAGVGAGIGSLVGLIVSAARRPNPQSPGP